MTILFYRTTDGRADYKFSFERQSGGDWIPFILSQPSYGSRDTDLHPTHRLIDTGRYYVCWTDPLRTLSDAKRVAALWADATQNYIRSGTRF